MHSFKRDLMMDCSTLQTDSSLPPLYERLETLVVQDLADDADVFMEFGHLSAATRKRIAVSAVCCVECCGTVMRKRERGKSHFVESPLIELQ